MDAATAIATVLTVIRTASEVAPVIIEGISDLKAFAVALYQKFTGEDISADDLANLEAQIDALHAELQEPLPDDL